MGEYDHIYEVGVEDLKLCTCADCQRIKESGEPCGDHLEDHDWGPTMHFRWVHDWGVHQWQRRIVCRDCGEVKEMTYLER